MFKVSKSRCCYFQRLINVAYSLLILKLWLLLIAGLVIAFLTELLVLLYQLVSIIKIKQKRLQFWV